MRRGPGIVALERTAQSTAQYSSLSEELNEAQLDELRSQVDAFARALRTFAVRHRREICREPSFRQAFQRMCASVGVDPLAGHPATSLGGTRLGKVADLWNDLLGFSDWQYELGVQIVDVCVSSRPHNGGLIAMDELIDGVMRLRLGLAASASIVQQSENSDVRITEDDILRSLQALKPLGCGYEVLRMNGVTFVRTMLQELNASTVGILEVLTSSGAQTDALGIPFVSATQLATTLPGAENQLRVRRAQQALDDMTQGDGLLWVDVVPPEVAVKDGERCRYYSLSLAEKPLSMSHGVGDHAAELADGLSHTQLA